MTMMLEDLAEVVRIRNGYLVGDAPYWIEKLKVSDSFIERYHAIITDMAKQLEAAERDAARYRFIRDSQATIIYKRKGHGEWEPLVDTCETSTRCASLDDAIDAAMQESGEWTEGVG